MASIGTPNGGQQGHSSRANRCLVPIYLDDQSQHYAQQYLWPADGHPKAAAEMLHNSKKSGSKDPTLQQAVANATRHLEAYSDLFVDTLYRSPESRLLSLQYIVKVQDQPCVILADNLKWDLNTPDAMVGLYAARIARDIGLGQRAALRVEEELHKIVYRARRALLAGENVKLIERPKEGEQLREGKWKYPRVFVGEQAQQILDHQAAKRMAAAKAEGAGALKEEEAKGHAKESLSIFTP